MNVSFPSRPTSQGRWLPLTEPGVSLLLKGSFSFPLSPNAPVIIGFLSNIVDSLRYIPYIKRIEVIVVGIGLI